jgi:arsenate reductase
LKNTSNNLKIVCRKKMMEEDRIPDLRMEKKKQVLFVCTQNAGRSQMAEGYLRARYGNRFEAFSAGTSPTAVSRKSVLVMNELGIDISGHRSKSLDEFAGNEMDVVVTLCDHARGICPFFPWAKKTITKVFPDPGLLSGDDEEILNGVRNIRDQITRWIDQEFGESRQVSSNNSLDDH